MMVITKVKALRIKMCTLCISIVYHTSSHEFVKKCTDL